MKFAKKYEKKPTHTNGATLSARHDLRQHFDCILVCSGIYLHKKKIKAAATKIWRCLPEIFCGENEIKKQKIGELMEGRASFEMNKNARWGKIRSVEKKNMAEYLSVMLKAFDFVAKQVWLRNPMRQCRRWMRSNFVILSAFIFVAAFDHSKSKNRCERSKKKKLSLWSLKYSQEKAKKNPDHNTFYVGKFFWCKPVLARVWMNYVTKGGLIPKYLQALIKIFTNLNLKEKWLLKLKTFLSKKVINWLFKLKNFKIPVTGNIKFQVNSQIPPRIKISFQSRE